MSKSQTNPKSQIQIYNSLTRKKDCLEPLSNPPQLKMYVCGPTVYDDPHIGHARSAYIFDVIRRYLKYRGYDKIKFVRNVTDVDDKIIDKAKKEYKDMDLNIAVKKVSDEYLKAYHEAMKSLGILEPDIEPKASEYISKNNPAIQKFIQDLINRGRAYVSGGDVYFDIKKAEDYGKLSNQSIANMEVGARVLPGENKRDPLDFALWKAAKEDEPSWDSPWGKGRPGWHIECSVMSSNVLGDEFDIHGGGLDLIFPHHENEIAQSEGAGKKFARIWMHHGLLTINGQKMSKSLGNFVTIKDFLAKYDSVDLLKLFFLSAHYSHPIDYTDKRIEEAKASLTTLKDFLSKGFLHWLVDEVKKVKEKYPSFGEKVLKVDSDKFREGLDGLKEEFIEAMDDDFNTPQALAVLFKIRTYVWNHRQPLKITIKDLEYAKKIIVELGGILGLSLGKEGEIESTLKELIEERAKLRKAGDFEKADQIRQELEKRGLILEDIKEGKTIWHKKV